MDVSVGKLALTGGGLLFIWSGLRGASVLGSFRDLIAGKKPVAGADPISAVAGGATTGNVSSSANAIASDAMKYNGDAYKWGRASFPSPGGDCSGLVNDVTGRDLGLAIPGYPSGKFRSHGPATGQWFTSPLLTTIPASEQQAGDIVCWLTHMGIAQSSTTLISALNPSLGVKVTTVKEAAPPFEPMRVRRYK
jgi:hypothetical protein